MSLPKEASLDPSIPTNVGGETEFRESKAMAPTLPTSGDFERFSRFFLVDRADFSFALCSILFSRFKTEAGEGIAPPGSSSSHSL